MYKENDKVMVTCKEIGNKDELAYVASKTPFGAYEVTLLMDHKPSSAFDPVRVFGVEQVRFANEQEVVDNVREWEEKHNYKLGGMI